MSMPEGSFGGHIPTCHSALCLNQRHRGADCRRCVDSCPTGAIRLEGVHPSLDETGCVQCGGCAVACPTDVFSQTSPPEPTLAQTLAVLPAHARLALVCPRHPTPSHTPSPVDAVVRHARCLAALSLPFLLELSRQGERSLWLDDSPCAACPFAACHALLVESVAGANALLAACGRNQTLQLATVHGQSAVTEADQRPVLDGMRPQLSRRSFFVSLRRMGEERVERALLEDPPPMLRPAVEMDKRLPRRLPASHRRLLAWLAALNASEVGEGQAQIGLENLPFAAVEVDGQACSACGLCARFCPTGALEWDGPGVGTLRPEDPQGYALFFQPRLCIDCDICRVACPEMAVSLGPSLPLAALREEHYACLAAGEVTPCMACGVAVADHIQPALCYVCRIASALHHPQDE